MSNGLSVICPKWYWYYYLRCYSIIGPHLTYLRPFHVIFPLVSKMLLLNFTLRIVEKKKIWALKCLFAEYFFSRYQTCSKSVLKKKRKNIYIHPSPSDTAGGHLGQVTNSSQG